MKKHVFVLWAIVYVVYHYPSGDVLGTISNVDPSAVSATLAASGVSYDILDQATYTADIAGLPQLSGLSAQTLAYELELSTTQNSLIGKTTGYISANAIGQVQINSKLARIAELDALLGL